MVGRLALENYQGYKHSLKVVLDEFVAQCGMGQWLT